MLVGDGRLGGISATIAAFEVRRALRDCFMTSQPSLCMPRGPPTRAPVSCVIRAADLPENDQRDARACPACLPGCAGPG